jgi:hypothetical protein
MYNKTRELIENNIFLDFEKGIHSEKYTIYKKPKISPHVNEELFYKNVKIDQAEINWAEYVMILKSNNLNTTVTYELKEIVNLKVLFKNIEKILNHQKTNANEKNGLTIKENVS